MLDEDTMTEYFTFEYNFSGDKGVEQEHSSTFTFPEGTSLYTEQGVVDVFIQFLRGVGYNPDKLKEALDNL
jgi:hypothetical protein|tara:strand:- start:2972 stop:3184 length:213 start_codon:yes stop_codon:yes gene_type:complete